MAAKATDWLSLSRMKAELRIPEAVGDHDLTLRELIQDAVGFCQSFTSLPLLDGQRFHAPVAPADPVRIPPTLFLKSVDKLETRASANAPWADLGVAKVKAAGAAPNVLDKLWDSRVSPWRYWPDKALPDGTVALKVTVTSGMDPWAVDNQQVRQALVLMVRDAWEGVPVADRTPAWERVLQQTLLEGV